MWSWTTTRRSTSARRRTTGAGGRRTPRSSARCWPPSSGWTAPAGCSTSAAAPGSSASQLAPLFEHVTLLEPDPDMLAEARAYADEEGVEVDLVRATAEELGGPRPRAGAGGDLRPVLPPGRPGGGGRGGARAARSPAARWCWSPTTRRRTGAGARRAAYRRFPHEELRDLVRCATSARSCGRARGR